MDHGSTQLAHILEQEAAPYRRLSELEKYTVPPISHNLSTSSTTRAAHELVRTDVASGHAELDMHQPPRSHHVINAREQLAEASWSRWLRIALVPCVSQLYEWLLCLSLPTYFVSLRTGGKLVEGARDVLLVSYAVVRSQVIPDLGPCMVVSLQKTSVRKECLYPS